MKEEKMVGRPKTVNDRVIISHGIPRNLLNEIKALAKSSGIKKTEIINQFIIDGLKKGKI